MNWTAQNLGEIPQDLWYNISQYLSSKDIINFSSVCRSALACFKFDRDIIVNIHRQTIYQNCTLLAKLYKNVRAYARYLYMVDPITSGQKIRNCKKVLWFADLKSFYEFPRINHYYNHIGIENLALMLLPQDSSLNKNDLLAKASFYGHVKVVKHLLHIDSIDPAWNNNFAFRQACRMGHEAIVEELLKDGRIDPQSYADYALRMAVKNGNTTIALLIQTHIANSR
jgi:hypothetical protein